MHIHVVDVYHPGVSLIHRLDVRLKLVLAVLFIITIVLTPDGAWLAYGLLLVAVLVPTVVSRLGMGFVQRRAAVAFPFALAAVTVMFSTPGRPLLSGQVLGRLVTVTHAGLIRFISIVLKSWLSMQVSVILTASTSFPALLQAMQSLRIPRVLVGIAGFTYRYLFVIGDEALRLLRARAARSAAPDGRVGQSVFWRARVTGGMIASLFLRSLERSERIYYAMLARGYDGEVRLLGPRVLMVRDVLIAVPAAVALVVVQVVARVRW